LPNPITNPTSFLKALLGKPLAVCEIRPAADWLFTNKGHTPRRTCQRDTTPQRLNDGFNYYRRNTQYCSNYLQNLFAFGCNILATGNHDRLQFSSKQNTYLFLLTLSTKGNLSERTKQVKYLRVVRGIAAPSFFCPVPRFRVPDRRLTQ
jgi:hypothetical protein